MRFHPMIGGILISFAVVCSTATALEPLYVGDYGNSERLVFKGCKGYSSEAIVNALMQDFDVALAAHPAARYADYRKLLEKKIVAGYQKGGFPDVRVNITIDQEANQLVIAIDEGSRFMAGKIVVRGHQKIDSSKLIEFLTSPAPPSDARMQYVDGPDGKPVVVWVDQEGNVKDMDDPPWELGEPASFDATSRKGLCRNIKQALLTQGFLSEFRIELDKKTDAADALLVIEITDEDHRAVLGDITVKGNTIHSREEIIDYLELKPGMVLAVDWRAKLHHRLWRSGRFITTDVSFDEPTDENPRVALKINLVESPWAPKLAEPLSRVQEILLKMRDQLVNPKKWTGDMVVTDKGSKGEFTFVISPSHGSLGKIHCSSLSAPGYPEQLDASFVLADQLRGVFCAIPMQAKLASRTTGLSKTSVVGSFRLGLVDPKKNSEHTRNLLFSFGVRNPGKKESPKLFQLRLDVPPAYVIAITNLDEGAKSSIEDGVLTITSSKEKWRVDEATGRLLEFTMLPEDKDKSNIAFGFEKGAFNRHLDEIVAANADCPNVYDDNAPWTSWIQFLCHEQYIRSIKNADAETLRWLRLARVMQSKGVFEGKGGLSEIVSGFFQQEDKRFTIPYEMAGQKGNDFVRLVASVALMGIDQMFSRNSWPWSFSRELVLVLAQHGEHTNATLQDLWNSDKTGPMFYLTICYSLELIGNHQGAKMFANQGLGKLSTGDFKRDCRALFHSDKFIGRSAVRLVRAVRELSPDEVDAILGERAPGENSLLAEFMQRVRENSKKPADEVLTEAFVKLWETGLRDKVKAQFILFRDGGKKEVVLDLAR